MTDEDEARIMLAATAIVRTVSGMPLDLAISALMIVVTDLIRSSKNPAQLWAALVWGIEAHRELQQRIIFNAPDRLQ